MLDQHGMSYMVSIDSSSRPVSTSTKTSIIIKILNMMWEGFGAAGFDLLNYVS